ncbi:MAG: RecX family transcriptional regulator [Candidatus Symbiobacter sp.]|nr:RecX family transcriptional regulator [Candidatus Symbiobacter sp.]
MNPPPSRRQKPLRIPDLAYLERVALWYLERYAASRMMLRRVLMRRVDRAVRAELLDAAIGQAWVEQVIAKSVGLGYVEDENFARTLAARLNQAGRSHRQIDAALRQRGLEDAARAEAFAHLAREADANGDNPEWLAALALARRRLLGPYRTTPLPDDPAQAASRRRQEFAVLARAGFRSELARLVVEGEETYPG